MPVSEEVTRLLIEWKRGDQAAVDLLVPWCMTKCGGWPRATFETSGPRPHCSLRPLVHEAYLRLVAQNLPDWESRSHFFGVAAHLMRQILVDHARRQRSGKRGGGAAKATLDEALSFAPERSTEIVALNDALEALAKVDERKCRTMELRFFGGFSVEETAQALGISEATIGREQRLAEAWLHRELSNKG